jgi:hypothetical protein
MATWEAVAQSQGRPLRDTPVEWTDVHVLRPVRVQPAAKCTLLTLLNVGGSFQVNVRSFNGLILIQLYFAKIKHLCRLNPQTTGSPLC